MCSAAASLTLVLLLSDAAAAAADDDDDDGEAEGRARGKPEVFLAEATPQDCTTSMETMVCFRENEKGADPLYETHYFNYPLPKIIIAACSAKFIIMHLHRPTKGEIAFRRKKRKNTCEWPHEQYKKHVEQSCPPSKSKKEDFMIDQAVPSQVQQHPFSIQERSALCYTKDVLGICKQCGCRRNQPHLATKCYCDALKFTLKERDQSLLKGDNEGVKWIPCTISLQPMRESEMRASVINMPSLTQGQAFSNGPQQHNSNTCEHRGISQQALMPSSGTLADKAPSVVWKRNAHSATMYTRYRCPEFALMYTDDLESSNMDVATSIWSINIPESKNINIEKIKKFRLAR